jgi:hypothetical protein
VSDLRILADTPPEFAFVVEATRWPRDRVEDAQLRASAVSLDWARIERIACRHRVEGLVWAAVRQANVELPPVIQKSLEVRAGRIAHQNARIALECASLQKACSKAGIDLLFIKGLSLAQLVYGSITLKAGWDIDILVPPARAAQAASVLRARGYVPEVPSHCPDAKTLLAWHRRSKESVWRHAARGIYTELHTALVDHPMLLRGVSLSSPRQNVRIGPGITLPTLATSELFSYLCVHGASSAWFRLKWIADLGALLAPLDSSAIDLLYEGSRKLGAGRAADVGLILCQELYGTDVNPSLLERLRDSDANRKLLTLVRRSLVGAAVETELSKIPFGTFGIHLFQMGVMPGMPYKLQALLIALRTFSRKLRKK